MLVQHARVYEPIIRNEAYSRLGKAEATVELHENGVLLHFRETESDGVVVSLDRDAARDLSRFVTECNNVLIDT